VIIQQPATQPAPVIITPPAPTGGSTAGTTANALNDATIQSEIDKKIGDDPAYSSLGITATVLDGKVTLVGTVKSDSTKQQIERMVRHIKGVKSIDNQIVVVAG
jgi:osmotically-inducible protein OsmY